MPLIGFISNSRTCPPHDAVEDSHLLLVLRAWTEDQDLHFELVSEPLAEPGQILVRSTSGEIVSVDCHRDLPLLVPEVARAAFACFKAKLVQKGGVCLSPILGCISCPVETEIQFGDAAFIPR